MKILMISTDYPKKGSNIYTDLSVALKNRGHYIKVVVAEEKKKTEKTYLHKERNIDVLRVKTGNMYEVGFIEKTLTFLNISKDLKKEIKNYYGNEKFDLILFHTPPVTLYKVIRWTMNYFSCKSYLMQKDIFPQNGVDLGLYSKLHPAYIYFRHEEKKLYKVSSVIGCMSNKNIEYLQDHNKYLPKEKFELFPNTTFIEEKNINEKEKIKIRKKYNISENDIVATFGGNFGKPQGLSFLLKVIEEYKNKENLKFLLIGRGTEKKKVFDYIKENNIKNVLMYDFLPKEDYEILLDVCDIGLIFLDKRFTIPNFPSKTLSYFSCKIPIMAAIDNNTDYGQMLQESKSGFWCLNGDIKMYKSKFDKLLNNKKLRKQMGINGFNYLKDNYDVNYSVNILEKYEKEICDKV